MCVKYPTVADIIAIHDDELEESGGEPGIQKRARIESAVTRPKQGGFGQDYYPDLPSKAGVMFHELLCGHGFVDGNKRTAVTVVESFLNVNGARLEVKDREFEAFVIDTADKKQETTKEVIIAWFRKHIRLSES